MATEYPAAARRHDHDAALLHRAQRVATADHLYGLSAECSLKAVLLALGYPARDDGSPKARSLRVHVDELWPAMLALLGDRTGGRLLGVIGDGDPFSDWDIAQRYAPDAAIGDVDAHRDACDRAARLLDAAMLDGWLR